MGGRGTPKNGGAQAVMPWPDGMHRPVRNRVAYTDLFALEAGVVDKYVHPPKLANSVINDLPAGSRR